MSIDYYNEITPHELNLHIQAYNEQLQREVQREERQGLTVAYLTAYWGRVKKMPSLKSILSDIETKSIKSDEQLLRMVRQLNAAMGGKEVKREIGK